jgi:hypothetical protein
MLPHSVFVLDMCNSSIFLLIFELSEKLLHTLHEQVLNMLNFDQN